MKRKDKTRIYEKFGGRQREDDANKKKTVRLSRRITKLGEREKDFLLSMGERKIAKGKLNIKYLDVIRV